MTDSKAKASKTKTSFYRRLYVAYLIEQGVATVPDIVSQSGMPRRTVQDTILALAELDIDCVFVGANKNGAYQINSWGAINRQWLQDNVPAIKAVLGYP